VKTLRVLLALLALLSSTPAFAQQGSAVVHAPGPTTGTGNWVRATSPVLTSPNIGATDAGISRLAAASLAVGNGTASDTTGTVTATNFRTVPVLTANLPACGFKGTRAFVTDASVATFGAGFSGGGSNAVPVYCDGNIWRVG
jgi:hypothetical protein